MKVHASDGALHDEQTITVNLTNVNDAPDALFLSNFLVTENQSVGSLIGLFSASDEDGLSDLQSMNFQLVNGSGENNNSLFTLDTNGTLKNATVFDYESNASSYTISVQAKDELNAFIEGNFTVTLVNVVEDLDQDGTKIIMMMISTAMNYLIRMNWLTILTLVIRIQKKSPA